MASSKRTITSALSTNMIVAVRLLELFLVAIIVALIITLVSVPSNVQILALFAVTPFVILSIIFIYYCKKRKAWSFAGATILGAAGVILRVVVSTQPNLEVGGGLPTVVTVLYIVLGALVSLTSYGSFIELKK